MWVLIFCPLILPYVLSDKVPSPISSRISTLEKNSKNLIEELHQSSENILGASLVPQKIAVQAKILQYGFLRNVTPAASDYRSTVTERALQTRNNIQEENEKAKTNLMECKETGTSQQIEESQRFLNDLRTSSELLKTEHENMIQAMISELENLYQMNEQSLASFQGKFAELKDNLQQQITHLKDQKQLLEAARNTTELENAITEVVEEQQFQDDINEGQQIAEDVSKEQETNVENSVKFHSFLTDQESLSERKILNFLAEYFGANALSSQLNEAKENQQTCVIDVYRQYVETQDNQLEELQQRLSSQPAVQDYKISESRDLVDKIRSLRNSNNPNPVTGVQSLHTNLYQTMRGAERFLLLAYPYLMEDNRLAIIVLSSANIILALTILVTICCCVRSCIRSSEIKRVRQERKRYNVSHPSSQIRF